ncbi:hypothetical protein CRD60_05880 [Bifidobacterium aemilianum]|uniref:DUF4245 domain-containing protein n=1 Tax=Bifidobacterium aemilianum TaxID=2493120 RepID=A0A366K709_9BIFI|nr:hypothetical protein [Bifidobacterium aemilianum]RBP97526.1 hypothetical protein CRD60_05880 [Bifidobacterium aemilianum]
MVNSQTSSSHGKLIAAVLAAVLVVVLALLSAFVWPGWAMNREAEQPGANQPQEAAAPTKPSIKAEPLPGDASELLKAMPDSVLNFARTKAETSTSWSSSSPLEQYTLTYSTGAKGKKLTLLVAQWAESDKAKSEYVNLTGSLEGKELAGGDVKVSGATTGSYTLHAEGKEASKATAVWQNDTVVFQVSGDKDSVQRFYQKFPL